jgi:hypothetical protein
MKKVLIGMMAASALAAAAIRIVDGSFTRTGLVESAMSFRGAGVVVLLALVALHAWLDWVEPAVSDATANGLRETEKTLPKPASAGRGLRRPARVIRPAVSMQPRARALPLG